MTTAGNLAPLRHLGPAVVLLPCALPVGTEPRVGLFSLGGAPNDPAATS